MEILEAIQAITCFATAKLQQIFHICKFLSIFFQIKCNFIFSVRIDNRYACIRWYLYGLKRKAFRLEKIMLVYTCIYPEQCDRTFGGFLVCRANKGVPTYNKFFIYANF